MTTDDTPICDACTRGHHHHDVYTTHPHDDAGCPRTAGPHRDACACTVRHPATTSARCPHCPPPRTH